MLPKINSGFENIVFADNLEKKNLRIMRQNCTRNKKKPLD